MAPNLETMVKQANISICPVTHTINGLWRTTYYLADAIDAFIRGTPGKSATKIGMCPQVDRYLAHKGSSMVLLWKVSIEGIT